MEKGKGILKQIEDSKKANGINEYSDLTAERFSSFIADLCANDDDFKPDFSDIPKPSVVEKMTDGHYMFNCGIYSKAFLLELSKAVHGE